MQHSDSVDVVRDLLRMLSDACSVRYLERQLFSDGGFT